MTSMALELTGVSHGFTGNGVDVVSDVTLVAQPGEFISMVGASGSGKTTLLRMLAGLIVPDRGGVRLGGENVAGRPDAERVMVFQDDRLFPWRDAAANVAFGLEILGIRKPDRLTAAKAALGVVGLAGRTDAYPAELSGGMRQRVNLARALVLKPQFLLMDEPFASLDAQTREVMQRELLGIHESTGVGVVFVTHQIEEALFLADRVVVLGGRPAQIRKTITVPFGRPRGLDTKRIPRFQELYNEVWQEIQGDVERAILSEEEGPQPGGAFQGQ